jgi:serine/threonine protein kinase
MPPITPSIHTLTLTLFLTPFTLSNNFPINPQVQIAHEARMPAVLKESAVLSSEALDHPFIAKLCGKFQTPDALVWVFEPALGGDLWGVLYDQTSPLYINAPREERIRGGDQAQLALPLALHYLASVVLALSHLHKHDMVYRNLKPENVLIDAHGHIKLVGFSLAKTLPYADEEGVLQNKVRL